MSQFIRDKNHYNYVTSRRYDGQIERFNRKFDRIFEQLSVLKHRITALEQLQLNKDSE